MHRTLCDTLLDLVQNALEAGAARVSLILEETGEDVRFHLEDDGRGMDAETLRRARDPFFTDGIKHPGRRTGLGLPFLEQAAQATGGRMDIRSRPGEGTVVEAVFPAGHLDLPPRGDVPDLIRQSFCFDGDYEMVVRRHRGSAGYEVSRSELREVLGDLNDAGAMALLGEFLKAREEETEMTEGAT